MSHYLVFVYGTLKRGESNHRLLAGRAGYVGPASINGNLFDLGPFPAAIPGDGVIKGELFFVGPNTLRDLDQLEGHPTFYKREEVPTLDGKHKVWVYFYQHEFPVVLPRIESGVWCRHSKASAA